MRPLSPLLTAGLATALLAGCVDTRLPDYPVPPPPLSESEQQEVRDLVADFAATDVKRGEIPGAGDLKLLDAAQEERIRKAREPFNYGESAPLGRGDDFDIRRPRSGTGSGEQSQRETDRDYSRNEINAIERRVGRRYESAHDRRHELKAKYGL